MASNIKHLMTVADLDAFPDDDGKRYELIEGELFVSCAPGLPHQLVLAKLITEFTVYLKRNPIGIAAPGPGAVFSNYDAVIPDLVFARTERLASIVGMTVSLPLRNSWLRSFHPEAKTARGI